jgi:ATP-dependent phosphofructokinase / diphosphate-dependent phosphofructokinase
LEIDRVTQNRLDSYASSINIAHAGELARRQFMSSSKTIGVLTSGGDCAGLNAVIRAVVARAVLGYGWRVVGIRHGTEGLSRRPVDATPLDLDCANPAMLRIAGPILGTTNRGDPFAYPMPDGSLKDPQRRR